MQHQPQPGKDFHGQPPLRSDGSYGQTPPLVPYAKTPTDKGYRYDPLDSDRPKDPRQEYPGLFREGWRQDTNARKGTPVSETSTILDPTELLDPLPPYPEEPRPAQAEGTGLNPAALIQQLQATMTEEIRKRMDEFKTDVLRASRHENMEQQPPGLNPAPTTKPVNQNLIDFGSTAPRDTAPPPEPVPAVTQPTNNPGRGRLRTYEIAQPSDDEEENPRVIVKSDPSLSKFNGEDTVKNPYLAWRVIAKNIPAQRPNWTDARVGEFYMRHLGDKVLEELTLQATALGGVRFTGSEILTILDKQYVSVQFRKQAMKNLHQLSQRSDESLMQFFHRVRKACYTAYFDEPDQVNARWRELVRDGVTNTSDHAMMRETFRACGQMNDCFDYLNEMGPVLVAQEEGWAGLMRDNRAYSSQELIEEMKQAGRQVAAEAAAMSTTPINMSTTSTYPVQESSRGSALYGNSMESRYLDEDALRLVYTAYEDVGQASYDGDYPDCYDVADQLAANMQREGGDYAARGENGGRAFQRIDRAVRNGGKSNNNSGRPSFFREWMEKYREEFLQELRRILSGHGVSRRGQAASGRPKYDSLKPRDVNKNNTNSERKPEKETKPTDQQPCDGCRVAPKDGPKCKEGRVHFCSDCWRSSPKKIAVRNDVAGRCMVCQYGYEPDNAVQAVLQMTGEGRLKA